MIKTSGEDEAIRTEALRLAAELEAASEIAQPDSTAQKSLLQRLRTTLTPMIASSAVGASVERGIEYLWSLLE